MTLSPHLHHTYTQTDTHTSVKSTHGNRRTKGEENATTERTGKHVAQQKREPKARASKEAAAKAVADEAEAPEVGLGAGASAAAAAAFSTTEEAIAMVITAMKKSLSLRDASIATMRWRSRRREVQRGWECK